MIGKEMDGRITTAPFTVRRFCNNNNIIYIYTIAALYSITTAVFNPLLSNFLSPNKRKQGENLVK